MIYEERYRSYMHQDQYVRFRMKRSSIIYKKLICISSFLNSIFFLLFSFQNHFLINKTYRSSIHYKLPAHLFIMCNLVLKKSSDKLLNYFQLGPVEIVQKMSNSFDDFYQKYTFLLNQFHVLFKKKFFYCNKIIFYIFLTKVPTLFLNQFHVLFKVFTQYIQCI